MAANNKTQHEVATTLGVHWSTVSKWIQEQSCPGNAPRNKLTEITGGAIRWSDWETK